MFRIIDNKSDAQYMLNRAESVDFYLEECHDDMSNSISRRNLTYYPNIISSNELKKATSFIETVIPKLPMKLSELNEINIIQLMPTADGGMPHTRPGNIICYPDLSLLYSVSTLIHELWHVHQRNFKPYWSNVFHRLGLTLWAGKLPDKLENNRRYNPDTIDSPLWIFKKTWVPVPIFKDIRNPSVNNVEIWFYNINGFHTRNVPEELSLYFKDLNDSALEHPREMTAYMLAEPDKYKSSPAFKDLIKAIGNTAIRFRDF